MGTTEGTTTKRIDPDGVGTASGLDYQAFWTTDAPTGWLDQALGQAAVWVKERLGLEIDISQNDEAATSDRSKRAQIVHRQAGRDTGVRLRAWNTNAGTTFTVTVLAFDGPGGGWLMVQASSSDRTRRSEKPAVADLILSVVDFSDVGPLHSTAHHITHSDLDDLEDLINHPDRRFPVIVAAPLEGVDFDRWIAAVNTWARRTAGIAHITSLDPNSAVEFVNRHGRRAVQPGTLRTYPPGADLADPALEQTARWLSARALAGSDTRIARVIEAFVRQYQVTHPSRLPPAVRDWSRAFDRLAAQQLRSAVSPATPTLQSRIEARHAARIQHQVPAASPASPDAAPTRDARVAPAQRERQESRTADDQVALLRMQLEASDMARSQLTQQLTDLQEFLSLPDLEEASLLELLDAATRTQPDTGAIDQLLGDNDELRVKVDELEDELLLLQVDHGDLSTEQSRLEVNYEASIREIAFLRSKVAEHDTAAAFSWVDDGGPSNPLGECPTDWNTFIEDPRLAQNGLVFTGNPRRLKDIAGLDLDGAGISAAWDSLGTLAAYRKARLDGTWKSNVQTFCEAGPLGAFHVPPNKHAPDETSATRKDKRLADHRLLPIPETVEASGHVYMWTHFKPYSWSSQQKLRIHYYDQVTSDTKVYIGHIGFHLPSGSTDKIHR